MTRRPLRLLVSLGFLAAATPGRAARADGPLAPPPPAHAPSPADPGEHPRLLAVSVGAVDLGSAGANGGAISTGLRLRPCRYFEASLDLGYGLLDGAHGPEDRWWAMPGVALVIPVGRLSLDLGAGIGVGTVSGYDSWSGYFAQPFAPLWHLTVPAVSAHAGVAIPLTGRFDLFVRAEAGSLLLSSQDATDAVWYGLTVGVLTWVR